LRNRQTQCPEFKTKNADPVPLNLAFGLPDSLWTVANFGNWLPEPLWQLPILATGFWNSFGPLPNLATAFRNTFGQLPIWALSLLIGFLTCQNGHSQS